MRMLDILRWIFTGSTIQGRHRRSRDDFSCGECERLQRCGLPPHQDCVVRAAQLARGRPMKRLWLPSC
jgi:hypothetical protein